MIFNTAKSGGSSGAGTGTTVVLVELPVDQWTSSYASGGPSSSTPLYRTISVPGLLADSTKQSVIVRYSTDDPLTTSADAYLSFGTLGIVERKDGSLTVRSNDSTVIETYYALVFMTDLT